MITFDLSETDESIFDGISKRTFTENEDGWVMPEPGDETIKDMTHTKAVEKYRDEADFINELYGLGDEDHDTALDRGHIYESMRKFAISQKAELLKALKWALEIGLKEPDPASTDCTLFIKQAIKNRIMITPLPEIEESIFDGISERTFTENENEDGWVMPEPGDETIKPNTDETKN